MKFLKNLFSKNKEAIELHLKEADKVFEKHKSDDISKAEKRAEELSRKADKGVKGLEEVLEDIKGFEDDEGRKAVNDIAENLVESRKKVVNDFSLTDDPRENFDRIQRFIADFHSMKRKEVAVLEMTSRQKDVGRFMKEVQEAGNEMEEFLEDEYSVVETSKELEEDLEELEDLENKIQNKQEKREDIDTEGLKQKISEKEAEIEDFKNSSRFEEYKELKQSLEERKSDKQEKINALENAMSKMKRGLKKLIYQAENSELVLEDTEVLRLVRDQETDEVLKYSERVADAMIQLKDKGDITEVQRNKILSGANTLENTSDYRSQIEGLQEKIEELDAKLDSHPAVEEIQSKKGELENLEKDLEELQNRREDLKNRIDELKDRKESLEKEIKKNFRAEFDREIKFE